MLLVSFLACPLAMALDLTGSVFDQVGRDKGLDPVILYSVALAESAYRPQADGYISPYPFTLRTATRPYYFKTKKEAAKKLRELLQSTRSVDVGPMQINVKWHSHRVKNVEDLLDTETNIRVAADILNERLRANNNDWLAALGQYHSFDAERSAWYGSLVLNIFYNLKNNSSDVLVW